ncbi:MAG: glutathione S-transferase family protein [Solirubrobacteraceae bacterium]
MTRPVLWHIEISHYNEKVRWALDLKGIEHERRAPLPGVLHPIQAFRLTRQPHFPILVWDGRAIPDSTAIIAELERRVPDPPLYPADPVERARALELEDSFDEEVAPYARRLAFVEISRDPAAAAETMGIVGMPGARIGVGRALAPHIAALAARRYGGTAASVDEAHAKVRAGAERLEAEIGPSGYLVGDAFGVADLTAASIFAPLVQPPEFQYVLPEQPPALREFVASLPAAGMDWVRAMWSGHRPQSLQFVK